VCALSEPIDFKASLDSLELMQDVIRHFYLRALSSAWVPRLTWAVVDGLMLKTLAAAEKPARRPAPLAQTIRYSVTGSGTPFSFMAAALLGDEQSCHLRVRPPDPAPAVTATAPGSARACRQWAAHAPKAVAGTREALGAARPRPPMRQSRWPVIPGRPGRNRASGLGERNKSRKERPAGSSP
jgi:hypothetical protein